MTGAETVLILVVLIVIGGQAGMALLLHAWARRVAEQRKTRGYRALRGLVSWATIAAEGGASDPPKAVAATASFLGSRRRP